MQDGFRTRYADDPRATFVLCDGNMPCVILLVDGAVVKELDASMWLFDPLDRFLDGKPDEPCAARLWRLWLACWQRQHDAACCMLTSKQSGGSPLPSRLLL